MSFRAVSFALHEGPYEGKAKLIHIAIAEVVNNDTFEGWISWKSIANAAGCSKEYVRRTLKVMQEDGALEVVVPASHHRATVYRLVIPGPGQGTTKLPSPEKGATTTAAGGNSTAAGGNSPRPLQSLSSVQDNSPIRSSPLKESQIPPEARRSAMRLAEKISQNGSKQPNITQSWLTDLDRMARIDGRTWQEIDGAIDWCQQDPFWMANIQSPKKLRKHFDQMRLQARRSGSGGIYDQVDHEEINRSLGRQT